MIDLEMIDKLFEAGRTSGAQVQFRIFDKRVLLPLRQLLDAASGAAGQTISEAELRIMAGQGWFPLLRGAGGDGNEEGAPIYAPDRVGLFVKLQHQGYSTDELRLIAEFEEAVIDDILTVGDLAYADDDLDTLVLYAEARIDALEHGWREDSEGVRIDSTADLERARREVRYLQDLQAKGVPDRLRERIEKQAFRVRAMNEAIRIQLVEMDRAKSRLDMTRASCADPIPGARPRASKRDRSAGSRRSSRLWPTGTPPRFRQSGFRASFSAGIV
jgi:hypothetical protein